MTKATKKLDKIEKEIKEKPIKSFDSMAPEELLEILGLTIKKDNANKLATFLCMLSSLTEDSQFNISFNSISSSGKSYLPSQIGVLFPNVIWIDYASPTAFYHTNSKYNKETKEFIVDLERKIIVFRDMPDPKLLERIRGLLSHDSKETKIQIVDRGKKRLETKNIVIRGFCSVVFCSARVSFNPQELTRFLLLSPELDQEKIRMAILERIKKESNTNAYESWVEADPKRRNLKERIENIQRSHINQINIPQELSDKITKDFFENHKLLKARDTRDISRLISLMKSYTLLNLWNRKTKQEAVIECQEEDYKNALKIWKVVERAQELNMPPYVYEVFTKVLVPLWKEANENLEAGILAPTGISRLDVIKKHYQIYGTPLPDWQLRQEIIPAWRSCGLVSEDQDPENKRRLLIRPTDQE